MSLGFLASKKEFTTSFNTTFSTSSSFTTTFNTSRATNFTTTFNTASTVFENNNNRTDSWYVRTNYGNTEFRWLGGSSVVIPGSYNYSVTYQGYTYYRGNSFWFNSTSGTFYYLNQRSYQSTNSTSRTTSRTTTFSTSKTTTTSFNTSRSTDRTTSFYA